MSEVNRWKLHKLRREINFHKLEETNRLKLMLKHLQRESYSNEKDVKV